MWTDLEEGLIQLRETEYWLTLQYMHDSTPENKDKLVSIRVDIMKLELDFESKGYPKL